MEGRNLFSEQPKEAKGRNLFSNQQQVEQTPIQQQPVEQASQPIEAQNGLPNIDSVPTDTGIVSEQPIAGEQAESSNMLQDVGNAIAEFAASGNRAAFDALDFMLPDNINAILELSGSDQRVPTFSGKLSSKGGFMEPGVARDVVQGLGQLAPIAGGAVPAVGRNLASMGGIAKEALGVGSAVALQPVKALQEVATQAFPSKAMTEAKIPLFRGAGEAKAAGFKLDDAGRVVKDAVQQSALKADIPSDTVSFIASSSPQTKKRMAGMMDVLEKGKESRRYRAFNVPQQVIGEAMEDRLSVLQRVNREAASRLDEVANSLSGQKVDVSTPIDAFKENLAKQRVKISKNGSLSFKGSSIEGLTKPQKIISNVYNRLRYTEDPTKNALRVHDAKKFIDEQVSYGKSQDGLSGTMEGVIKKLRKDLDGVLDAKFADYNDVNTAYSETRGIIDTVQDLAGKKTDLNADDASRVLGTMSRKVLTNYNTGQPIGHVIDALDDFGKKYGTPAESSKMQDSIKDLVAMESYLREAFPRAAKPGSLEGIGRNIAGGTADMVTGNNAGVLSRVMRAAGDVFSPSEEAKIKALKELMK
jgi:hypothetical protein